MISQGLQEVERGVLASIGVLGRAASGGGPLLIVIIIIIITIIIMITITITIIIIIIIVLVLEVVGHSGRALKNISRGGKGR